MLTPTFIIVGYTIIFPKIFYKTIDFCIIIWYNKYVNKTSEVHKMNWFEFSLNGFLLVFIVLNVLNVIIQTVKSIATVKWGAWGAATTNAIAYGLYTIVVVYMNADGLGLAWKAVIIGLANLFGVFVVKVVEEKKRKDKLWKVECTVPRTLITKLDSELDTICIPHNYLVAGRYGIFNCYCATQKDSELVKKLLIKYEAKYFVTESKTL